MLKITFLSDRKYLFILVIILISLLFSGCEANNCGFGCVQGTGTSGGSTPIPTTPIVPTPTPTAPVVSTSVPIEAVCRGEKDYPITDMLSGLTSGFYRIEFYIGGTGPEYESWLSAGLDVSYKVNSNANGHVWEFPSVSCTRTNMMDDAIASHRRRSAQTTVSSSSYVDPSDSLVTSNFVRQ